MTESSDGKLPDSIILYSVCAHSQSHPLSSETSRRALSVLISTHHFLYSTLNMKQFQNKGMALGWSHTEAEKERKKNYIKAIVSANVEETMY